MKFVLKLRNMVSIGGYSQLSRFVNHQVVRMLVITTRSVGDHVRSSSEVMIEAIEMLVQKSWWCE